MVPPKATPLPPPPVEFTTARRKERRAASAQGPPPEAPSVTTPLSCHAGPSPSPLPPLPTTLLRTAQKEPGTALGAATQVAPAPLCPLAQLPWAIEPDWLGAPGHLLKAGEGKKLLVQTRPGPRVNVPSCRPSLVRTAQKMGHSQGLTDVHSAHSISGQPGGRGETCESSSFLGAGESNPGPPPPRSQAGLVFPPLSPYLSLPSALLQNKGGKGSSRRPSCLLAT